MLKKSLSIIILVSMVLHCSSRLGFLSYLYEKRHDIAYTAGLISEIPIALCKSDYPLNKKLNIQHQDTEHQIPASLIPAQEIHLFFQINFSYQVESTHLTLPATGQCAYTQKFYQSPLLRKFQPPKIS